MKRKFLAVAVLALIGAGGFALAEGEAKTFHNTAEFAAVITGGNSQTTTLSFKDTLKRTYANGELELFAGFLRAEQTDRTARNVGGLLVVDESTSTNAESYQLRGKYRQQIREGFFWYVDGGWEKNRPTGIDSRIDLGGGAGYLILRDAKQELAGELGLSYVAEDFVAGTIPPDTDYLGARGFLGYKRKLSETASFNASAELLQNLDESEDLRANLEASVVASLTDAMALKVGYTVRYDKSPVTQRLTDPTDPGAPAVLFEFDSTDTILAASLVVNY